MRWESSEREHTSVFGGGVEGKGEKPHEQVEAKSWMDTHLRSRVTEGRQAHKVQFLIIRPNSDFKLVITASVIPEKQLTLYKKTEERVLES